MKTNTTAAVLLGAAVIAGCAKDPEQIEPAYMPPNAYAGLDCPALQAELTKVRTLQESLYKDQNKQRMDDAAMIILIGISPTMLGAGKDNNQRIATVKGAEAGVKDEMLRKGCAAAPSSVVG